MRIFWLFYFFLLYMCIIYYYCYHPRVVRLSVISHSQWLLHGRGTLYHNMFGARLLFPSFAEN